MLSTPPETLGDLGNGNPPPGRSAGDNGAQGLENLERLRLPRRIHRPACPRLGGVIRVGLRIPRRCTEQNPAGGMTDSLRSSVRRALTPLFRSPRRRTPLPPGSPANVWNESCCAQYDDGVGRIVINPTATRPAWGVVSSVQNPAEVSAAGNATKTGADDNSSIVLTAAFTMRLGPASIETMFVAFNPGWETRHAAFYRLSTDGTRGTQPVSGAEPLTMPPKRMVTHKAVFNVEGSARELLRSRHCHGGSDFLQRPRHAQDAAKHKPEGSANQRHRTQAARRQPQRNRHPCLPRRQRARHPHDRDLRGRGPFSIHRFRPTRRM